MKLTDIPLDPSIYDRIYDPEVQAVVIRSHHTARWSQQAWRSDTRRSMLRERVEEYRHAPPDATTEFEKRTMRTTDIPLHPQALSWREFAIHEKYWDGGGWMWEGFLFPRDRWIREAIERENNEHPTPPPSA